MRRAILMLTAALLLCVAITGSGRADTLLPEEIHFTENGRFPVHTGPGADYPRSGNGRAEVSTNGWIQVFGTLDGWAMIQYEIAEGHWRIGWIDAAALPAGADVPALSLYENPLVLTRDCVLTDDPMKSCAAIAVLPAGAHVVALGSLSSPEDAWYLVRAETAQGTMLGFVSMDFTQREHPAPPDDVRADLAQRWPGCSIEDYVAVPGTPDGDYAFALVRAGGDRLLAGYLGEDGAMRFVNATRSAVPQGEGDAYLVWYYKGQALYDELLDSVSQLVSDGMVFRVVYARPEYEFFYQSDTFRWTPDGFKLISWYDSVEFYGEVIVQEDRLAFLSWALGDLGYAPNTLETHDLWEVDFEALKDAIALDDVVWN